MKINLHKSIPFIMALIVPFCVHAQRYVSEVFSSVTVTSNIQYGENFSNFPLGTFQLQPLIMDVYEPAGDPCLVRPVIVLMHTGSYLPRYCNGTPTGDKNDSATVEMANRFAKRGYVVANIDYRLGWNPLSSNVDVRRGTLLQAVYRSLQDAKACVRFLKKDAYTNNVYKIDTNAIILGGQGTGGYIALNYISLDDPAELSIPKLISGTTDPLVPIVAGQSYINQNIFGDLDGFGGDPAFNNSNNSPGYTNNVHFAFNMGGALGDSTWIEPGDAPTVAFHVVGDPFAPYYSGIVYVPGNPPQAVIDVIGSGRVLELANQYGNNNCFSPNLFNDSFTQAANNVNNGVEGLFPFHMIPAVQSGPWEWWDSLTVVQGALLCGQNGTDIHMNALITNGNMSKAKAMAYIDTVMGYLNPRIELCLNLCQQVVGTPENESMESDFKISPNPAQDYVSIASKTSQHITAIELFDYTGRKISVPDLTGEGQYTLPIHHLASGTYFIKIESGSSTLFKKLQKL